MTHYPRLDLKEDIVFKLLFSKDEEILIALLTAVLKPPQKIARTKLALTVALLRGAFAHLAIGSWAVS